MDGVIFERGRVWRHGRNPSAPGENDDPFLHFRFRDRVELHGGVIAANSDEGEGSTFTFSLPIAPGREHPPGGAPAGVEKTGVEITGVEITGFEITGAETMFRECLAVFPRDKAAQIYLERRPQMPKTGIVWNDRVPWPGQAKGRTQGNPPAD